jgi:hypothetical protein
MTNRPDSRRTTVRNPRRSICSWCALLVALLFAVPSTSESTSQVGNSDGARISVANVSSDYSGESPYLDGALRVQHELNTRFRSFQPDSVIEKAPAKRNPIATRWNVSLINTTGSTLSMVELQFGQPVSISDHAPFPYAIGSNGEKNWLLAGQQIASGDSVTISGTGPATGVRVAKWRFADPGVATPFQPGFVPSMQQFLLPMPNAANVRFETFALGGFGAGTSESDSAGGMVVGTSFMMRVGDRWRVNPDSGRLYGWVRVRRQQDFLRSLASSDGKTMHSGPPRGFCYFDNGRRFLRQVNVLPPGKMSNRLFAQLLTLKLNIAASTLGITPVGFGELVYQEGSHPLSGLMIKEIAGWADRIMTYCRGQNILEYYMLDTVLAKINAAFSGPIDTLSFGTELCLSGVRDVDEVPFLHRNSNVEPTRIAPSPYDGGYDETDDEDSEESDPSTVVGRNYPNPFNPVTMIHFELSSDAIVTISVHNLLGQRVALLASDDLWYGGDNEIELDARSLPSGVYFYRIAGRTLDRALPVQGFGKMLLLK